jgi:hypothetical protein
VRRFVVCRTEVAERGVGALTVVEALDVLEDRAPRCSTGWPAVPREQVELEGREEALGDGVVPAVARPAQAGANPWLSRTLVYASEVYCLAAAVGVMDERAAGVCVAPAPCAVR